MAENVTLAERLRAGISEEIRVLLVRRRMSPTEMARRLGWSQSYISRRMVGDQAFDVDDLVLIAGVLEVAVADLLPPSAKTRPDTQPYEGQPGLKVPVVTGTVAYPEHPILARAVRLPLDRRTAPTGR